MIFITQGELQGEEGDDYCYFSLAQTGPKGPRINGVFVQKKPETTSLPLPV